MTVDGKSIIDNDFPENINAEDSLWTLEEGEVQDYKGIKYNCYSIHNNNYLFY